MRRILVAGGAGFIGSNFVRHLLAGKDYRVRVLDKLTYAGNLDNFPPELWKSRRFEFVRGDICDRGAVRDALRGMDAVVNFAAQTHIDRSVDDVRPFVQADFVGTSVLLEEFRREPRERFVQVSTCEVYGSARDGAMAEDHPLMPQSPYAATKAGADRLCHSYAATYDLPVVILRPFNQYGPNQYPEKVIPFFVVQALRDRPLFVYGTGRNTRDWTYVPEFCQAVRKVIEAPRSRVAGQVVNVGSGVEASSLDIATAVLDRLGKPRSLVRRTRDRPGHVQRLVCDTGKARRLLNWRARVPFQIGLKKTIDWYLENPTWWGKIMKRKRFRDFYSRWYGQVLGAVEARS